MTNDRVHVTFTKNPLAMFAPQPLGVKFEGQEKGEKIILLLRAHVIILVPPALVAIFLILTPLIAAFFLGLLDFNLLAVISVPQIILILAFWYLSTFAYAFYQFVFWYFNVYLLTNERIVDVDFRGLLHKETAYAKLSQIQDVSPKTIGFFGTFFHYGNVYVQTAAERPEFEFHHVPRPNQVAQEILEQVRHEEAEPLGVVA